MQEKLENYLFLKKKWKYGLWLWSFYPYISAVVHLLHNPTFVIQPNVFELCKIFVSSLKGNLE